MGEVEQVADFLGLDHLLFGVALILNCALDGKLGLVVDVGDADEVGEPDEQQEERDRDLGVVGQGRQAEPVHYSPFFGAGGKTVSNRTTTFFTAKAVARDEIVAPETASISLRAIRLRQSVSTDSYPQVAAKAFALPSSRAQMALRTG